ncbi:UNVERIFIED_CONTAM: hypothetical protein FKN15_057471 [Acipenser sinensis]
MQFIGEKELDMLMEGRRITQNEVPDVISSIRQVSKAALKENTKTKQEGEDAFYNSQKFEMLYCGKVTVANKKAPSTLIDECIEKFKQHEVDRQRLKLLNEQRGSADSHVEFTLGDGDPLTDSLKSTFESSAGGGSASGLRSEGGNIASDLRSEGGDRASGLFSVSTSQASLWGSRSALPECILEDSDFDDQQEFRSRCNSVAAVMQKKVSDSTSKGPVRRRHASAPSHVQPSDAEKNRTMLFQVCIHFKLICTGDPISYGTFLGQEPWDCKGSMLVL